MKRIIYLLIPSLHPTGPIKGAIALANAMVENRKVFLVTLKSGPGAQCDIDDRVKVIHLYKKDGWINRLRSYRQYLNSAGRQDQVASISSCFSADFFNLFMRKHAVICSSVRSNLPQNYKHTYGWTGLILALVHFALLRGFHHVVTMTQAMARQVAATLGRQPTVIANFVDERVIEPYRHAVNKYGQYRLVFVGSLTLRKQPMAIVKAMEILCAKGYDFHADFIGDGPVKSTLEKEIQKRKLTHTIHLHGHLIELFHIVSKADVFVLPSSSEGVSRACLEALHLGVPCVLRDVDGNGELIQSGVNGILFHNDADLPTAILAAIKLSRENKCSTVSLLPPDYRQENAARAYLNLVEDHV